MNRYEMMLKVAADSPSTLRPTDFERYLEECQNAGYDLEQAKRHIALKPDLNPNTRHRMKDIFENFVDSLKEED